MKRCPKCGCDRFIVSQHVVQTVMVDDNGEFISEVTSCDEVTHKADDDDLWVCEKCGYNAAGSEFNVPKEKETLLERALDEPLSANEI